jgi:hypothetical protein
MEENNEKKKSFEEILNELNLILEKMPPLFEKKGVDEKKKDDNKEKDKVLVEGEERKDEIVANLDEGINPSNENVGNIETPKQDDLSETEKNNQEVEAESYIIDELQEKKEEVEKDEALIIEEEKETKTGDIDLDKEINNLWENLSSQETVQDTGEVVEDEKIKGTEEISELKIEIGYSQSDENKDVDKEIKIDEDIKKEKAEPLEVIKEFRIDEESVKSKPVSDELDSLINMSPPANIPPDRIKNVGFIYLYDEDVFVNLLKNIDEISLSSKEKPMFVKRSFVIKYDDNVNNDVVILNSKKENVCAVVFVGQLPTDKKYEFENSLSEAKIYFANFNKTNLNKSAVIDFIMELIIR